MAKRTKLPPDPDRKNAERADSARKAVIVFMRNTGTEYGDAVCDLLCNLMHMCDRKEAFTGTFRDALARAGDHYLAETDQPGPLTK